ncbi:PEP-CTERM sorting domain-containing protein [Paucibacter sp. B2R-40]|uniref:PEP-CTERM sorting domain-containing protein n=1 Tax=Paucibacter sp. B2R-40 TaxID=2893554 RepID=UPI0021E4C81C|nr:PEP-CTERM sorting domain-containing protein [Paucibacter sp. B2R-40]MCV2357149.1 PEP-CTERM sorting domain-containing protein [Paucibacter sp. B2R-40]
MKKLHSAFATTLLLAGLATVTSSALATDLSLKYTGISGGGVKLDIKQFSSNRSGVTAGLLNFETSDKRSFSAYCVELGQYTSSSLQTYQVGSFNTSQGSNLQNLLSASYASVDTNTERAAFQLAVWELTHESKAGKFSVTEGSYGDVSQGFSLNDSSANYASLMSQANSYLDAGAAYKGANLYQVEKLSNADHQDLLRFNALPPVTAVPEPSSYALLMAGLGVIGFVSRRRSNRHNR